MLLKNNNIFNYQSIIDGKENALVRISQRDDIKHVEADIEDVGSLPPALVLLPDAMGSLSIYTDFIRCIESRDIYALVANPFMNPACSLTDLSETFVQLLESENLFYRKLVFVGYGAAGLALADLALHLPESQNRYCLFDPVVGDALPKTIGDEAYQLYLFARGLGRSIREQSILARVEGLDQKLDLLHEFVTLNAIDVNVEELKNLFVFFRKNLEVQSLFTPSYSEDLELYATRRIGKRHPTLGWGSRYRVASVITSEGRNDLAPEDFSKWLAKTISSC